MKTIKIAIYSGEIPSTTFIERLIEGMSLQDSFEILLFGVVKRNYSYNSKVKVYGFTHRLSKLFLFIKYSFLLNLFNRKEKKKLDLLMFKNHKNFINYKIKYYPVLYHKPDIFHLQWAKSIADWVWVKDFGIKLVLSLRGAHINYSPVVDKGLANQYQNLFPKVDAFHAVSKAIAEEASNYYVNILSKSEVIYSGVEVENNVDFSKSFHKTIKIISAGRNHWVKGYNYALDTIAYLKNSKNDINYTIFGLRNDEELLFQRKQLNLESRVNFVKNIPIDDLMKEIKDSDILLLPSIKEGIANVVLEAMSVGTIVLSTECGGMNEVIEDGVNGFLCPVRDSEKMANTIEKIINLNKSEIETIRLNAYKRIIEQHSYEDMINKFHVFYKNLI